MWIRIDVNPRRHCYLFRLRQRGRQTHCSAKTAEFEAAASRVVRVPVRRPACRRVEDPSAASVHTVRALFGPPRIDRLIRWISRKHVLTPFPDIAVHVMQTPAVRLLLANGMGLASDALTKPSIFPKQFGVIAKTIGCGARRTASVLPFGFCRQPIQSSSCFLLRYFR